MADNPQIFSPLTLGTLSKDALTINEIASVVGVSALYIAAPIAREMTATENPTGVQVLLAPLKDLVVNFQQEILGPGEQTTIIPITHEYLASDYNTVVTNNIKNNSGSFLIDTTERGLHPVLNDIGPGKINIETAIDTILKYADDPQYAELNLAQYIGHYDQLVRDMQNPATEAEMREQVGAAL